MDRKTIANDVDQELDDALATLWLVRENEQLAGRMYEQIVDLLLERVLLDLRTELILGHLTASTFANELARLAEQCRDVGLLSPDR